MKGLVKVTPESLINLTNKCCIYMNDFSIERYKTIEKRWSWREFKKVDVVAYSGLPFWYGYKKPLINHMHQLHDMADQGDEIWLSELSYCHLLMLSNGNKNANPIYIMDY